MMRWALQNAVGPRREVIGVAAIDNSEVANAVYSANFPRSEPLRRNVEHITREQIEENFCSADVWTASPPCQPYTRKGNEKHGLDPRALSFLQLLDIFPTVKQQCKPKRVLVENVVGFENSATREALVETLGGEYHVEEFVGASPRTLGVPNTRERYYLLAKRKELGGFPDVATAALPFARFGESETEAGEIRFEQEPRREVQPVGAYLRLSVPLSTKKNDESDATARKPSRDGASLAVPASAAAKYWRWFDVVTPSSLGSQCFTAGYGKTVFGGSVLAAEAFAIDPEFCELADAEQKRYRLVKPPPPNALRYFAPEEIAALHGLESASAASGPRFALPENLTRRQLYFTLGNSVSVDVVQELMRYLMEDN
jgi:tRNA (cytosine38-C5)-methyltransferase